VAGVGFGGNRAYEIISRKPGTDHWEGMDRRNYELNAVAPVLPQHDDATAA
jgi:hypothetical protein